MRSEWIGQGFRPPNAQEVMLDNLLKGARLEAVQATVAGMLMALWDEYGFGKKRSARVLDRFTKIMGDAEEGTITIPDMVKWCDEELGVVIK